MAKPKFDYDSDEFYEEIFALSLQGLNDAEIADALYDRFKANLDPDTFSAMKGGRYPLWTLEENKARGERINRVLARGRRKINGIVRGAYLKAALGGKKTRNKSTTYRHEYDDQGNPIGKYPIQEVESEIEMPPNIQALSTWMYHHDPEWRKIQRGLDTETSDIPADIDHGIDIDAWIRKEAETFADKENHETKTE